MSDRLTATYELNQLEIHAHQLKETARQLSQMHDRLRHLLQSDQSVWQGRARTEFAVGADITLKKLQTLQQSLFKESAVLSDVIRVYRTKENINTALVDELSAADIF